MPRRRRKKTFPIVIESKLFIHPFLLLPGKIMMRTTLLRQGKRFPYHKNQQQTTTTLPFAGI